LREKNTLKIVLSLYYSGNIKIYLPNQELNDTSDRTALRDLENLIELNIFVKDGVKKGTIYKLKSGGKLAYILNLWRIYGGYI
jgi:hypothetical protein